ncbi:MAG TPA: hypothetical protein VM221_05295 [Armatimonadota bacterium]|nr:hypothetical protein [Armatimonadota bacterium]
MAKQTKKQALEERTQQRPVPSVAEGLAARKEAAKKSAETRRARFEQQHPEVAEKKAALKKHEAKLVAETRRVLEAEAAAETQAEQPKPAPTAPQVPKAEKPQVQATDGGKKRPQRNVAQDKPAADATLRSSDASSLRSTSRGAMATVALRGEQAQRLRALAAKHEMTLSKLLVRMMEVFETAK